MCKYLRNIDFFFMIALVVLEVTCVAMFSLVLAKTFELERNDEREKEIYYANLIYSILSISLEFASTWMIIVLGIHSLYFKVIQKLTWYIIM